MISRWWNALMGGRDYKATKTRNGGRTILRVEGLEGRLVPSASPITAPLALGATNGPPSTTAAQDLQAEQRFAAQLQQRFQQAQAEVHHDQTDIARDKDRIAHLGKDVARVTTAIAGDTNPTVLAGDKKRLAALTTQLAAANKDLTQKTSDLAADKLSVSSLKAELTAVRAVIAADLAGAKHDAAYAAELKALSDAVHNQVTQDTNHLAADKARAVTLAAQLAQVNANIAKDTGLTLAADRIIAGRLADRLHHLQMDVTHDATELAAAQAFSLQLDARLLVVQAQIAMSITTAL